MTIITEPTREQWTELVRRPAFDVTQLFDVVRPIMDAVHTHGDQALHEYGHRFDGVELEELAVSPAEVQEAAAQVPQELKDAIELAYCNIYDFHELQRNSQVAGSDTACVVVGTVVHPIRGRAKIQTATFFMIDNFYYPWFVVTL